METMSKKCYECVYCAEVPGSAHKSCNNKDANVAAHETGIKRGWFSHPYNFDPVWLISCTGFKQK